MLPCHGDQGDQGVTNVCGGKIFLKQFPADTAQWGLSLPAIVCISIQLLASCSHTTTTTTTIITSVGTPDCVSVPVRSSPTNFLCGVLSSRWSSLLTPQSAGFTGFSLFCSLRIREAGVEGLSITIIDDKN